MHGAFSEINHDFFSGKSDLFKIIETPSHLIVSFFYFHFRNLTVNNYTFLP